MELPEPLCLCVYVCLIFATDQTKRYRNISLIFCRYSIRIVLHIYIDIFLFFLHQNKNTKCKQALFMQLYERLFGASYENWEPARTNAKKCRKRDTIPILWPSCGDYFVCSFRLKNDVLLASFTYARFSSTLFSFLSSIIMRLFDEVRNVCIPLSTFLPCIFIYAFYIDNNFI